MADHTHRRRNALVAVLPVLALAVSMLFSGAATAQEDDYVNTSSSVKDTVLENTTTTASTSDECDEDGGDGSGGDGSGGTAAVGAAGEECETARVQGAQVERGSLAVTGGDVLGLVAIASGAVALGVPLVRAGRKRTS